MPSLSHGPISRGRVSRQKAEVGPQKRREVSRSFEKVPEQNGLLRLLRKPQKFHRVVSRFAQTSEEQPKKRVITESNGFAGTDSAGSGGLSSVFGAFKGFAGVTSPPAVKPTEEPVHFRISVELRNLRIGRRPRRHAGSQHLCYDRLEQEGLSRGSVQTVRKTDGNYSDSGIGTLHIKKVDVMVQFLVRADTSFGQILLSIILNDAVPVQGTS
ncbi:nucleoporin [Culex quinquefasciatus]|uniref:Nucleoporin n=1 Tax=Culex quinquefasciatus TaxID=7176 RepID=B0WX05_CULQU|nr:nucleoporin [Culex quinquefasciatus]|eukprot:XP_001861927.1 nucleoporin [Culex quinquefasciatus]